MSEMKQFEDMRSLRGPPRRSRAPRRRATTGRINLMLLGVTYSVACQRCERRRKPTVSETPARLTMPEAKGHK